MGCDIHLHTEVKINGKWEHYGHPNAPRNYRLFALMADVRNRDKEVQPVSPAKGLPPDVSSMTAFAYAHDVDAYPPHSMSWLGASELAALEDAWDNHEMLDLETHFAGYLFGNSWAGFHRYPEDRVEGVEDVRWVFWFDN